MNTGGLPFNARAMAPRIARCLLLVGLILFCASEASAAPRDGNPPQAGILLVGTPDYPTLKGFLHGLNDAGHVVGETLVLDMGIKTLGLTIPPSVLLRADEVIR